MPTYVYKCGRCGLRCEMSHRMLYTTGIMCDEDGGEMHRVPQILAVNWDGPKPSAGGMNPIIADHIANVDRSRDEFAEEHERHERESDLHS